MKIVKVSGPIGPYELGSIEELFTNKAINSEICALEHKKYVHCIDVKEFEIQEDGSEKLVLHFSIHNDMLHRKARKILDDRKDALVKRELALPLVERMERGIKIISYYVCCRPQFYAIARKHNSDYTKVSEAIKNAYDKLFAENPERTEEYLNSEIENKIGILVLNHYPFDFDTLTGTIEID